MSNFVEYCVFNDPELNLEENRIKLCYAGLLSKKLFHQELTVLNPNPQQFDPEYVFPRDYAAFSHNIDLDLPTNCPSLETIQQYVKDNPTMVTCIGSHRKHIDRSFQLIMVPRNEIQESPEYCGILLQFLVPMPDKEKKEISRALVEAYDQL